MKWDNFKKLNLYIIISFVLILAISVGCTKKQEKPKAPKVNEKTKALTAMDEKVDEIIKDIEKIQEEMKKPEKPKEEEEEKEEKGKEDEEKKNGEDMESMAEDEVEEVSNMEEGEGKKKEEKNKEDIITEEWEKTNSKIESLHSNWNSYEPMAMEDGVNAEDIEGFEKALNGLTIAGEKKNDIDSLMQANQMTYYIGNFFSFYENKGESEMIKIKYHVRQSHLMGTVNSWDEAESNIKEAKPMVNILKQRLELDKKGEETFKKLRTSIDDMEGVIKEKDAELLKIKRDIVMQNLEKVKEAAK
ncbi:hypothetical protein [Caldisalinibacter kiritimatiensis]|uniref:Lipoprotein n=1 Tax=Caldisalinibacter kiritimatiensis TaxID=1304284 RepID=R1CT42_9FIRM|nr:hypothetical protein [Caldisalinibacter kiritimatiensis]EOD01816.1 hypothetical protein L21TH_0110 [Caldisalinibacter kiritimatiensis]